MAWIKTVGTADAGGLLAKLYHEAARRAGRVFNVIQAQSLRPAVLRASTQLYLAIMHASDSPLSRAQREMIATAVSSVNRCHY